jgi:hypothetical protein
MEQMYTFHLLKQQIWARWDNDVSDELIYFGFS